MPGSYDSGVGEIFTTRRIRHITSIQIRNLTPFPLRDAAASALSQPKDRPHFTHHGRASDDLELTHGRKRSRRISLNSINTLHSTRSEEVGEDNHAGSNSEVRGRNRAPSRVSFTSTTSPRSVSSKPSAIKHNNKSGSTPSIRLNRPRRLSLASSLNNPFIIDTSPEYPGAQLFSTTIPDYSQHELEKVIKARLVQTFLAVTLPPSPDSTLSPVSELTPPVSPTRSTNGIIKKGIKYSQPSPTDKTRAPSIRSPRNKPPAVHSRQQQSISSIRSSGVTKSTKNVYPYSHKPSSTPSSPNTPVASSSTIADDSPDYLSHIHRPSINPFFPMDPQTDFSSIADLSMEKLNVELWAKLDPEHIVNAQSAKGKEKAKLDGPQWSILQRWSFSLSQLVLLSDETIAQLPQNALVVSLSPPGQTYYLPNENLRDFSPVQYSSDIEWDLRKEKASELDASVLSRKRHRMRGVDFPNGTVRSAGWQDLFKLVTLQSCIEDNKTSLSDITRGIDELLADPFFTLKREISFRETSLGDLHRNCASVRDSCHALKSDIASRRESIQQRRETLELARTQLEDNFMELTSLEDTVFEERDQLHVFRSRFSPVRTTLLSTVSNIYPIDLLSGPDLLFTILEVPLPIPLSPTDPAPPLSVPGHKDINEDTLATALGYAAQVLQLLAAYMGEVLIYPVTCIGSRSLIRDGISAMVGPRMFPLFSKGVDSYRFEYAVFLLNKDIELLMTQYDLKSLDMRHTLPNLKNLLLTLTNGEGAELAPTAFPSSPSSSTSGLESPQPESPTTPKPSDLPEYLSDSPPNASGSTTPTSTETLKKSRPFLGISFPSGFLRSRYSSASVSADSAQDSEEQVNGHQDEHEQSGEEDDRRTLRGVSRDVDGPKSNGPSPVVDSNVGDGEKKSEDPAPAGMPVLTISTAP